MTTHIYTHSGDFHADEVFACSVLSTIFSDFKISRTRDTAELAIKTRDPKVFCVDVGLQFSHEHRNYDHHQKTFGAKRDPQSIKLSDSIKEVEIPYSAAGLVWLYWSTEYIETVLKQDGAPEQDIQDFIRQAKPYETLDSEFVQWIDAGDNGIACYEHEVNQITLSAIVRGYNRVGATDEVQLEQFHAIMQVIGQIVKNRISVYYSRWKNSKIIDKLLWMHTEQCKQDKSKKVEILVINEEDLIMDTSLIADRNYYVKFVVYPGKDRWSVRAVPPNSKDIFSMRHPLLKTCAGLMTEPELKKVTGIDGLVFCHKNLFLAGAQTKQAAYDFAVMSLQTTS